MQHPRSVAILSFLATLATIGAAGCDEPTSVGAATESLVPTCITVRRTASPAPVSDATIYQLSPDLNAGASPQGQVMSGGQRHLLVRFDVSAIPAGAVVMDARMRLSTISWHGPSLIDVWRVTSPWSESLVTWNTAPTAFPVIATRGPDYEWVVTTTVQGWRSGTIPNHGVVLRTLDGSINLYTSEGLPVAARPSLYVCYCPYRSTCSSPPPPPPPFGADAGYFPDGGPDGGPIVGTGSSLIAHWQLDDVSDGTAEDATENAITGRLAGGADRSAEGLVGSALACNGHAGTGVVFDEHPALSPTTGITLRALVRSAEAGSVHSETIVSRETDVARQYSLRIQQARVGEPYGRVRFVIGGQRLESTVQLEPDRWNDIAGTYDGETMAIWINGLPDIRLSAPGLPMHDIGVATRLCERTAPNPLPLVGLLDEVQIHDRALRSEEILSLATMSPTR